MGNKTATYYPRFHQLTYWDSRNTTIDIDCRTYKCAKLVILTVKNLHGVNQTLIKQ